MHGKIYSYNIYFSGKLCLQHLACPETGSGEVNRALPAAMKGQGRAVVRRFFGSWSIEPAFILFYLGYTIKTGAGIVEQLILDKVKSG